MAIEQFDYDFILSETDGRIGRVTLNRPEKLNALSHELRGELYHALKEHEADPAVGVIIIKGAGRAFSAGYDLNPTPTPNHPGFGWHGLSEACPWSLGRLSHLEPVWEFTTNTRNNAITAREWRGAHRTDVGMP